MKKKTIKPSDLVKGFEKALEKTGYHTGTRKIKKRTFLCKEPGGSNLPDEQFTITAKNHEDAREQASVWNAVVIREITP